MTSVSQFDSRFSLQEQFDYINACGVCGPMQTAYSVGHRVHLQTHPQQKLDYVGSAILASPRKAALHLLVRRVRFQTSVLVEEGLDQVEPSHSSRSLQIQGSPSFGEMLRGLSATVSQAGVNESFMVQISPVFEQNINKRLLHARQERPDARGSQPESVRSAIDDRYCVDLGAGPEQHLRYPHGILRSLLTIVLHAIGSHIVQKGCVMQERGTLSNQFGILAQQLLKFGRLTGDYRLHR